MAAMLIQLYLLYGVFVSCQQPPFDGVIRPSTNSNETGRLDAILKPAYTMNHCANLHYIPSTNQLMIGWFTGCAEGANDTSDAISLISMKDTKDGGIWSSPNIIAQDISYSDQNPMFYTDPTSGILHLFYPRQKISVPPNQNQSQVIHKYSYNGTAQFFENETLIFPQYGSFVRQPMITRLDGSWLLPMYYGGSCFVGNQTNETLNNGTCLCSDYPYIMINELKNVDTNNWRKVMFGSYNETRCLVQPSVIRLAPNKADLMVFFRDRRHQYIYTAYSSDDGETWTIPKPIDIRNNDASIQAYTLKNGHIALVCNPINYTYPRDPLIIALSEDKGKTWPNKRYLENHFTCYDITLTNCSLQNITNYDNNNNGYDTYQIHNNYNKFHFDYMVNDIPPIPNCSRFWPPGPDRYAYPSVFQPPNDNRIHVAYTYQRLAIKYSVFDEEWVKKGNVTFM